MKTTQLIGDRGAQSRERKRAGRYESAHPPSLARSRPLPDGRGSEQCCASRAESSWIMRVENWAANLAMHTDYVRGRHGFNCIAPPLAQPTMLRHSAEIYIASAGLSSSGWRQDSKGHPHVDPLRIDGEPTVRNGHQWPFPNIRFIHPLRFLGRKKMSSISIRELDRYCATHVFAGSRRKFDRQFAGGFGALPRGPFDFDRLSRHSDFEGIGSAAPPLEID